MFVKLVQVRRVLFSAGIVLLFIWTLMIITSDSRLSNLEFRKALDAHDSQKTCHPVQKLAFLKTHKCASSTVQNILFRYGLQHRLNFVLPSVGNYLGRLIPFKVSMVKNTLWHSMRYNIFALHTIWNQTAVEKVMGAGTKYMSILRDPVDLFESLYDYAGMEKYFGKDIDQFARSLNNVTMKANLDSKRAFGHLGQNQMLFDFGLNHKNISDERAIKEKISEIDEKFDLIMIAERFDESLILMNEILCWALKDITSLKTNARKRGNKKALSLETRNLLKNWLHGDYMLYEHFNRIFEKKVEEFGVQKMQKEVSELRELNRLIYKNCVVSTGDSSTLKGSLKPYSRLVVGYQVDLTDPNCAYYGKSELSFIEQLRKVQRMRSAARFAKSNMTDIRKFIENLPPQAPMPDSLEKKYMEDVARSIRNKLFHKQDKNQR